MGAMSANAGDYNLSFRDRKAIDDASARIAAAIQFDGQKETLNLRLNRGGLSSSSGE